MNALSEKIHRIKESITSDLEKKGVLIDLDGPEETISEVLNLNVFTGQLEEFVASGVLAPDSHDVITLWDTLEHVVDPLGLMQSVATVLKPGGFVFLTTLNMDSSRARREGKAWHFFRPPKHLHYFSEKTLKMLLEKAGFEVLLDDDFRKDVVLLGAVRPTPPAGVFSQGNDST